jgi:1-acyl-sn-glycerol-3-phosphate acyltransferase
VNTAARPSLASRLVRGLLLWLYRSRKFEIAGRAPAQTRCVIIGAPHTTNWDFIFFLGITDALGIRPRFMGKASLFRWPMRRFMQDMGGVPVERAASGNYVDAMVAEFGRHDDFMLVIAPEGTRGGVSKWRSGFYHIAVGAGVPLLCGWVDQPGRRGGLSPPLTLTGDYTADMARVAAFYQSVLPDHPRLTAIGIDSETGKAR